MSKELLPTPSTITYTVFISSPGDVTKEREIVYTIIAEVNRLFRVIQDLIGTRIILDPLTWEKDLFPNTGIPQETIKKQIPYEKCEIFIGILWNRFGTPTGMTRPDDSKPYLSGTQQEIEEALEYKKQTGKPIIILYRKIEKVDPPLLDPGDIEQQRLVAEFFSEFKPDGKHPALVFTFSGLSFRNALRNHLFQAVNGLQLQDSHLVENYQANDFAPLETATLPIHAEKTREFPDPHDL